MGGRGAGSTLERLDGPHGGPGDMNPKWIQPDTPQTFPEAPTIRGVIGEKGRIISANEAVKNVNPYRDMDYGDYSMNCQRCVVAYELNRRGYRVAATETMKNDSVAGGNRWAKAFTGGKLESVGSTSTAGVNNNILAKMTSWGNGSRAIVKVKYLGSIVGHVFNVEYHNGKLYYYDPQIGAGYNNRTVFDHVVQGNVQIMRCDNLAIADSVRTMVRKR